jgi:hypothetical protein
MSTCPAKTSLAQLQQNKKRQRALSTSSALSTFSHNPDLSFDEEWITTAQYNYDAVDEPFIRIGETVIKNPELMIRELPGAKPQAITPCIPPDLSTTAEPPLVPQLLQWEETPQEIVANESEESEMEAGVGDSICSNIPVEKLPVVSKIECSSDVDVLTNLVIVQTGQLDTQAENLDVRDAQPRSVTQLSCAATAKTETYFEVTNRPAGTRFEPVKGDILKLYPSGTPPMLEAGLESKQSTYWAPFLSQKEYMLTSWHMKHKISKGAIDDFFKTIPPDGERIGIRNAEDIFRKIESIPYGIPNDIWKSEIIRESEIYDGEPSIKYTVHYRNVMQVVQFLIGYKPFEHDLTYSPVRHRTEEGQRIYNHMSSGDWWWNIQDHLDEDATVVPLLLASDKTMLTQHHGDKAAWPIYLTIGNLSNECRRTASKPALILIGFIPLASNGEDRGLKGELYHQALAIIMERRCLSIFLSLNIC